MMNILELYLISSLYIVLVSCKNYIRKDGKLLLNSAEIIDLIRREKLNTNVPVEPYVTFKFTEETINGWETEVKTTPEFEDDEVLRRRKVWSRWSKWGECSVTCGAGAMSRRRACVAGRCARGEREEQRRPCARPPCTQTHPYQHLRDAD